MGAGGFLCLSGFTTTTSYPQIALGLVLVGVGMGLFRSPNASSVMVSVQASKGESPLVLEPQQSTRALLRASH